MQTGLKNADCIICLYSQNYWKSGYCQQEWNAAISTDPKGKERKLIPFLIQECELPPLATPHIYKSLIDLSETEFRNAVLEAVK